MQRWVGMGGMIGLVLLGICGWGETSAGVTGFPDRVLYAPGHFGNSYEAMGQREMRAYLSECRDWGYNRYADWFDSVDCTSPFSDQYHHLMGSVLWQRKKANFRSAQGLGLACDLVITPNHVFSEQCGAEVSAVKSERIFGQLVCPSKPAGREVILQNYTHMFQEIAEEGVRLNALWFGPYDYGGCACEACAPWILTFAKLSREIQTIAQRYHPGIELRFIGWWWSEEEHRLFADWADKEIPGQVRAIALHIPYGALDVGQVPLPQGCARQAFVHIGYAEEAKPIDIYGQFGPVAAPNRLMQTVEALRAHGCTGVMAYSEGVYDDVNMALLGGLSSGAYSDSPSVLAAYARRYFQAEESTARDWAVWLSNWGRPFAVDAADCGQALSALTTRISERTWRLRQWEFKLDLLKGHQAIEGISEWTPERLMIVEDFWKTYERLEREVWGLGPVRGCLGRSGCDLAWYPGWVKCVSSARAGKYEGM